MNQNFRILIVDRHPMVSPSIRESLGKARDGAYVREASGYGDALFLLKDMEFDMLVYDSRLPEQYRNSLLKYVRNKYPSTKLIPFHKHEKVATRISMMKNLERE